MRVKITLGFEVYWLSQKPTDFADFGSCTEETVSPSEPKYIV